MSTEEDRAQEILTPYRERINGTPALLSLLYDADMLPEQIVSVRGAISVAAVVEAYEAGQRSVAPAPGGSMGCVGFVKPGA